MLNLSDLIWAIPKSWNSDTLGEEARFSNHPASGQCTVSSLLIQRHCGGDIIRCSVGAQGTSGIVHYFNSIDDVWIDTTASQFLLRTPRRLFKKNPPTDTYIFRDTWDRVDILEQRCLEVLDSRT